ncbi:NAD(P)H-quinone oxidoreductase [Candidatus Gottesmanbacteria bacterium]|nr:NAD(P)H-quinone oxidoreductase [Candidatus Gottesmanbacteria bacterium]
MKAVVFKGSGGTEVISIVQRPKPIPKKDEVLVNVHAAGLNRAEILQRKGLYKAPSDAPADIPGLEFAGEIEETGEKVMGITGGGSQAEYLSVSKDLLIPIPANLDFVTAAAIPEAYITASDAIYTQLQIKSKDSVLIHAIGSSVGIALLQILKTIGCQVIGTSRTQEKLDKAKKLGLDLGINSQNQDFQKEIKSVDAIIDFVGGPFLDKNIAVIKEGRKILILGLIGGVEAKINLNHLLPRRIKILTANMRTRPLSEKIAATNVFKNKILPFIASEKIKPVIDRVFKLEELPKAHQYMEENKNFGKIIIKIQ